MKVFMSSLFCDQCSIISIITEPTQNIEDEDVF